MGVMFNYLTNTTVRDLFFFFFPYRTSAFHDIDTDRVSGFYIYSFHRDAVLSAR